MDKTEIVILSRNPMKNDQEGPSSRTGLKERAEGDIRFVIDDEGTLQDVD